MSYRQRRWSGGLAEILCPTPIPNFRHILKVLPDISMVLTQFPVEHVDHVRRLRTQSRHMLKRIDGQVEPAHLVEHNHIEWSGGCALVIESAYVEPSLICAAMYHAVDEPTIAMEREDHMDIPRKQRVK